MRVLIFIDPRQNVSTMEKERQKTIRSLFSVSLDSQDREQKRVKIKRKWLCSLLPIDFISKDKELAKLLHDYKVFASTLL